MLFPVEFSFFVRQYRGVGFAAATPAVDAAPRIAGVPRLPLSTRTRADDSMLPRAPSPGPTSGPPRARRRSHPRELDRPDSAAELDRPDSVVDLDRQLRALSGRAARCRLVEGWLASTLLSRRSWFALGFVRLGDYTSERLGLGARVLEEEARVARLLQGLPRITAAFLDGSIPWTAVRLVAGVATPRDEERWIERAKNFDTRSLTALVRGSVSPRGASATVSAIASADSSVPQADLRVAAADSPLPPANLAVPPANRSVPPAELSFPPAPLRSTGVDEDNDGDPRQLWEVRISRSGRRLWRAACEMAQRTAGTFLTPAQVLEQVAAEAASGGGSSPMPEDDSWRRPSSDLVADASWTRGCETAPEIPGDPFCETSAGMSCEAQPPIGAESIPAAAPARVASLVEALTAEIARTADAPHTRRLPFLTLERAQELEEDDPHLAAFYAEQLAEFHGPGGQSDAGPAGATPAPPEDGWFEEALRGIGRTEGFAWLAQLSTARPRDPVEWLEAELRAMEALEPHTIDARLREVRRAAQALDSELAGLLRKAADRRLHRDYGLANLEEYVEARLGLGARTAWGLLAIERAVRRGCPLLGEAWRTGRVSSLAARILLPVIGGPHAGEWIARAGMVTLRRLEAEVTWALQRHDEERSSDHDGAGSGNNDPDRGLQMRSQAEDQGNDDLAPPPLDQDLTGAVLAGVTRRELQMRAQAVGTDDNAEPFRPSVPIRFHAPESVILLAEETMQALRRGSESRSRAFERMVAMALLEWMAAPKHRDPVFERDGWRCAVPGCSSRRNLHDHHVVFRSHGGDNAQDNRVTVCAAHHLHGLHRGRIRAHGRAPHAIVWELGCRFGYDADRPMARLVGARYVEGN
jgi:hypothetical protein